MTELQHYSLVFARHHSSDTSLLNFEESRSVTTMMSVPSPTIQDVYAYLIRIFPPTALLQLAALILNGLTQQNQAALDDSDTWTEQDQLDLAAFSFQHFNTDFDNDEEIA